MDPRDNVALAKHLVAGPKGQPADACNRGGCGRAYYGAFGVARDVLDRIPLSVSSTGSAHSEVVTHLGRSNDTHVQAIGSSLDNLRLMRNKADYAVGQRTKTFSKLEGQMAVALGSTIVTQLLKAQSADPKLSIP